MSKLKVISGMDAIKAFSKDGWVPNRQVGSRIKAGLVETFN